MTSSLLIGARGIGGRWVLVGTALLAPRAWAAPTFAVDQHVDPYDGCELWLGKADDSGVAPVRAECTWPDASPDRMTAALERYDQWGAFIPEIKEEKVLQAVDGKSLIWQHDDPGHGLSPRESQVWLSRAPSTRTFAWTTAQGAFQPHDDLAVVMPRDEGYWTVSAAPGGGLFVTEQLDIDPGGLVPHWLVHWFQTAGLAHDMGYLHGYLTASPTP